MSAWSNDVPNPFTVGGGGVSGSIVVYDAAGNAVAVIDDYAISWLDTVGNEIDITSDAVFGAVIKFYSQTPTDPGLIYATTFVSQAYAPVLVVQSPWSYSFSRIYLIGKDDNGNPPKIDFRTGGGPVSVLDGANLIVEGGGTFGGLPALKGKVGTVTTGPAGTASFSTAVSFGATFPSPPVVTLNMASGSGATSKWEGRAISVGTTGFTLFGYSSAGTVATFSVPWQWTATLES